MSEHAALPSRFLPAIRRASLERDGPQLAAALDRLAAHLGATEDGPHDDFETAHAKQWLLRLIACGCEADGALDGGVVDRASNLLASLAGPSGACQDAAPHAGRVESRREADMHGVVIAGAARPAADAVYRFRGPGPPTATDDGTLEVRIRSETLVGDSTGALVWPAGLHLARRIAARPDDFGLCRADRPARVLELGAGTGLVGLVAAAAAASAGCPTAGLELVLSDNDPYSLENLRRNLAANAGLWDGSVEVATMLLDWRDASPQTEAERFDVIIGGDLVYDLHHADLLRHVIERRLRRDGSAYIMIALRPTHGKELAGIEVAFGGSAPLGLRREAIETIAGEPLPYQRLVVRWAAACDGHAA